MNEFAYELGDLVVHATEGKLGTKMVVLARGMMQSKEGYEEVYLVGFNSLDKIGRAWMNVHELKLYATEKKEVES